MRGIHVAPLDNPSRHPDEKLKEFSTALMENFRDCYIPGQGLSLDETLIRAFGHIGFKVRVVTKAARYGIKLYVVTEAETGYVLNVKMYTGAVDENANVELGKTTQVVKWLCAPYKHSKRTVYIDRFYTSVEVMKELHEDGLYATGTVMANRIPKGVRWTAADARRKERGESVCHMYSYKDKSGNNQTIVLTIWKDRKLVYIMTSDADCRPVGTCMRRCKKARGIIQLDRPEVVGTYNSQMGGVDLSDMKRLFCQTRFHGLRRWWIRIFFYYLDVSLLNAAILYAKETGQAVPNLFEMKQHIIEHIMKTVVNNVGNSVLSEPVGILPSHYLEKGFTPTGRRNCALCLNQHDRHKTTSVCVGCRACSILLHEGKKLLG